MTAAFLRANRRTWSSLRKHRNYRIFFSGQIVSVTGTWMQNIAAAWLILELTHSPVAVGLLMLCQFLPATVLGLFSGVLVDRLDVRKTVIVTQAASMASRPRSRRSRSGGVVEPWMVYLLTGFRGISLVVDHPARQAFTFQLVGPAELPNAVALNSGLFNGTRVLGPALGGAVIAVAGPGACFLLNAVSFVAVLASLRLIRPEELFPLDRGDERPTFVRGSREAFAFVRRVPLAGVLLAHRPARDDALLQLQRAPAGAREADPARGARDLRDRDRLLRRRRARWRARLGDDLAGEPAAACLAGSAAFGIAELALAPQSTLGGAAPLLFVAGLAFTLWTSNANASLQLSTPDRLRGRMMGFYYFAFNGAAPARRPARRVAGGVGRDRPRVRVRRDGRDARLRGCVFRALPRSGAAAPGCASRYGERVIDLRTDTITQPTAAMRRAIADAVVGDEQKREDPTVIALEERGAELLGHEEAVFVPTATMANQIALRTLTEPGDEAIAEGDAHIFRYELGGPAVHSGLVMKSLETEDGRFTAAQLREVVSPTRRPARGAYDARLRREHAQRRRWARLAARRRCAR